MIFMSSERAYVTSC